MFVYLLAKELAWKKNNNYILQTPENMHDNSAGLIIIVVKKNPYWSIWSHDSVYSIRISQTKECVKNIVTSQQRLLDVLKED